MIVIGLKYKQLAFKEQRQRGENSFKLWAPGERPLRGTDRHRTNQFFSSNRRLFHQRLSRKFQSSSHPQFRVGQVYRTSKLCLLQKIARMFVIIPGSNVIKLLTAVIYALGTML